MNAQQQLRTAVANMRDELERMLALVDMQQLQQEVSSGDFKERIVQEFNTKLRRTKAKVQQLTSENSQLKRRVEELELQLANKENLVQPILSSPIKVASQDVTSSQLNRLPTQYSETELPKRLPVKRRRKLSIKPNFVEERVVQDSQDEVEPLGVEKTPQHYTALQRIGFLRGYYEMKLADKSFVIDLGANPITESAWVEADFVPNEEYARCGRRMTPAQRRQIVAFDEAAGIGHTGDHVTEDICTLQLMDKYSLPIGYMVELFCTTQEAEERKARSAQRRQVRIQRRLGLALAQPAGEFVFYEQVLNRYVVLGRVQAADVTLCAECELAAGTAKHCTRHVAPTRRTGWRHNQGSNQANV